MVRFGGKGGLALFESGFAAGLPNYHLDPPGVENGWRDTLAFVHRCLVVRGSGHMSVDLLAKVEWLLGVASFIWSLVSSMP